MLKARFIPCLDVKDGRVVKGARFVDLVDAGDPVEAGKAYAAAGADELCFLEITASHWKLTIQPAACVKEHASVIVCRVFVDGWLDVAEALRVIRSASWGVGQLSRREHILDAVSRAGVVRIRTIANNPLWLCALVISVSFFAALASLALGERAFAWMFSGVAILAFLFAVGFIIYFAWVDPDRLHSEEYQLEQRRLTLQSKEDPEPRAITDEIVTEETELPPPKTRGDR